MTNKKTRDIALQRISKYDGNFQKCTFGDPKCMELVWTVEYRTQILHHVCTYNENKLLFVVGSQKEILYVCFMHFEENVLNNYKTLMDKFGDKYISWYKNSDDEVVKRDLQHAVDIPTVLFWRKMACKLVELNSDERHRLLPAHEVVPHAISLWNKCKGGQDVVSRS